MATLKSRHNGHRHHIDLAHDMSKIKAAIFDTTQDIKGRAGEIFNESIESAKDRSEQFKENVADYTSDKPFKALGIALATGVVLGMLIRRK